MTPSARGWRTRDSPLTPFRFTRGREFYSKNRFLAIFGGFKGVLRLAAQAHGPGEADRIAFREGPKYVQPLLALLELVILPQQPLPT